MEDRKRSLEKEKEAPSEHHRQPVLPFRGKPAGLCTESTTACGLCLFFAWLFPVGNRVWDQYQGLSLIPTIMLPSLTGTVELAWDQYQGLSMIPMIMLPPCCYPGVRVWGQYQGLSMIPTIMLPSLTGTLDLDQLQELD